MCPACIERLCSNAARGRYHRVSEPLRELSWTCNDRSKRAGHPHLHSLPHRHGSRGCHSRAPSRHAGSVGAGRGARARSWPACVCSRARIQPWRQAGSPDAAAALGVVAVAAEARPMHRRLRQLLRRRAAEERARRLRHQWEPAECSRPPSRWLTDARDRDSCSHSRSSRPCCSRTALHTARERRRCVSRKSDRAQSRLDALRRQPHRQSLQSARADQPQQRAAARRRMGVSDCEQSTRRSVNACRGRRHHVRHRVERDLRARRDDRAAAVDVQRSASRRHPQRRRHRHQSRRHHQR